ncbi:MAG: cation diffusion facilitator family transporter [Rhodocyclaceae bacterium]
MDEFRGQGIPPGGAVSGGARAASDVPRRLAWALAATLGFGVVELLSGWWAGSLALMGDAGHMATDAVALGIAALAARMASAPPSRRHTYGLARAEFVAAFVNGLAMLAVVAGLAAAAVRRLHDPAPVEGGAVAVVAFLGLLVNLAVARLLHQHGEAGADLNRQAALLHVLGDTLGSVAALAAGVIVVATGWQWADPALSLVIGVLILASSLRLLRQALHALMEGAPLSLDVGELGAALAALPNVRSIHDLHVWSLASARIVLTAHVVVADLGRWEETREALEAMCRGRFGIGHTTFQPETGVRAMTYSPRRAGA